jgi:hypothetical protein
MRLNWQMFVKSAVNYVLNWVQHKDLSTENLKTESIMSDSIEPTKPLPSCQVNRLYLPDCTIGVLTYENGTLYTIEKAWRDNRPFESCIPEGEYTLRRVDSPRFGPDMWEVCSVPDRYHILIHVANTSDDVVGCIGLGTTVYPDLQGVGNSRKAIKQFYNWSFKQKEITLWVRSGLNTQP